MSFIAQSRLSMKSLLCVCSFIVGYLYFACVFRLTFNLVTLKASMPQFSRSVASNCDPMNRSMSGFPVHHQLPEFAQTHVHRVGDAIQPSHPLSSPSPPAPNPAQHQGLSNESALRMKWPKYWSFSFSISPSNKRPGLISFRMDWLDLPCPSRCKLGPD